MKRTILFIASICFCFTLTWANQPSKAGVGGSLEPTVADSNTALWSWGDGTTSAGTLMEASGSGRVSGRHAYALFAEGAMALADVPHDDSEPLHGAVTVSIVRGHASARGQPRLPAGRTRGLGRAVSAR